MTFISTENVAPRPIFDNNSGAGTTSTIKCFIEYPANSGNRTRLTFDGGSTVGTMPFGTETKADDHAVAVPAGAEFELHFYLECPGGITFTTLSASTAKAGSAFGTTAAPAADTTASGRVANSQYPYSPVCFIGMTAKPSALLLGDSRVAGGSDRTPANYYDTGLWARGWAADGFAYVNEGAAGRTSDQYITSNPRRAAITAQYVTDVFCLFGINNFRTGGTVAGLVADNQTLRNRYATGKRFWLGTVGPNTTTALPTTTLTSSGTTVTATTATAHNLTSGMLVKITGASPTTYNTTAAGAAITVTSPTTFTYTASSAPASSPATGTIVATDMWATLENQTAVANTGAGSNRTTYNEQIRNSLPSYASGYLEEADVWESARNSGLIKVDGTANKYTDDGLHETSYTYGLVQALPFFNAANFAR